TIRVGLNSGEIVVCAIGNDLHMDYTVVGQTAHLAARMEQMAKPGSVLTTADTLQLAEGYVAMKPLGPVPVKGLANPVQVYEVTGKILTLDASLQDAIPPMLDLLDALDEEHPFRSLDRAQHRQYTYQAFVRLLLSETRVQPVVAVFEDLHWNDSLSLGLLNEL